MLLLSLGINVVLNLTLIPTYGVIGGAIATASAIVITILIGQLKLNKELSLHPVHTVVEAAKMVFKNKNISSWN
jgi:O-antigen/teichoic acid export membrane protein